ADKGIAYHGPVRILHGQKDTAVPYALSLELAEKLHSTNVETYFIKDGDHSLSNPENLALLAHILDGLMPTL
ncbi:MAG: alpha/beta hydrolase, partial [Alphaproteobacteria bacterium]|nr:alpha/beta hydrolase [Alphaproteobacteria bacterium]